MLKKEVKEIIKQSLVLIVTAVVIPIPVLLVSKLFGSVPSYGEVFFFVFHVGLLIFSVFMGTSLFSRDMGDGGMEYLLTLPYSRLQLLAIKIVPRFLAVLAVFVLYVLLLSITGMSPDTTDTVPLLTTGIVFFLCISLFIIGVPFSITRGSIVISGLATLFALMVYLGIIHLFSPTALLLKGYEIYYIHSLFQSLWNMPGYIWFSAVTLLLGSLLAFIYAFKGFNLGTARRVIKRYLKVFIPVFVMVVAVSLVWATRELWTPRDSYYLTNSHQLVECSFLSARIYDKTGVKEISEGDFYWEYSSLEKGNYLYTTYNSRYDSKFVRLDLRDPNYGIEVIYTAKGNARLTRPYTFNNVFAFFERRYRDRRSVYFLVVVHPETGEFKKIEVPLHLKVRISMIYPRVFGADEVDGKRFWLIYLGYYKDRPIQRVWENGTVEKLAATDIMPFYVNGMLITADEKSILINKVTPEGPEVIKTHPVEKDISFLHFDRRNLDHLPVKELYGVIKDHSKAYKWKKLLRLDLETLELEEIKPIDGENRQGFFDYSFPDTWYYTSLAPGSTRSRRVLKKLYRLNQGKPGLIKEFELDVFYRKDYFGIFSTGLVLKQGGKITVYSLPALEKIEYKKLE